ncbi:MAG: AAA family ATPase [Polyangiales bacterium]
MERERAPLVADLSLGRAELRETHVSWVLLFEDEVLKLKKPVRFAFLDFSTLEARRVACESEVVLNRRLAGDVYLGVVPITRDAAGRHRVGGEGPVVEWAVHMKRLDDSERADVLLARGLFDVDHVRRLAERLVRFHAEAEVVDEPHGPGSVSVLRAHAEENLGALAARLVRVLGGAGAAELAARHRAELERIAPLLDRRRREGRVRDGHGDLRLDHVYFDSSRAVRVLDCVEFDRAFRVADVAADVTFFAMSLRAAGEDGLAEAFLGRVARDSADHALYALDRFYETYWALVRAKVVAARAAQAEGEDAASADAEADALVRLSARLAAPPTSTPVLVGIGGPIGVGKSAIGTRLSEALRAPMLESDRLRKQLAGVAPTVSLAAGAFAGAYSAGATERVYAELLDRARIVLESGRPVVVDASFRERGRRDAFRRLADSLGVEHRFVACEAPRAVLESRLAARDREAVVSDARVELLETFLAHYEAPTDDETDVVRLDTSTGVDESFARLAPWVDALGRGSAK